MEIQKGALGNMIRNARMEQQISQETLAELVGITPTHLKHIESEHRKPSLKVLFDLASILHISLDSLLIPTENKQQELLHHAILLLGHCNTKQLKIIVALIDVILKNS